MIDGDLAIGEFNPVNPIPVTMGAEHLLSITIDFGDMAMSYDFTDISAENNYGWGNSFDRVNNKLTITNNSTCEVDTIIALNIDTETYPCLKEPGFQFTLTNNNGNLNGQNSFALILSRANTSFDAYLNVINTAELADMHNYNFNNAKKLYQ